MNPKSVLKYASEQGAKFVSTRFTDLPGSWQHLTFPISELDAVEDTKLRFRTKVRDISNASAFQITLGAHRDVARVKRITLA